MNRRDLQRLISTSVWLALVCALPPGCVLGSGDPGLDDGGSTSLPQGDSGDGPADSGGADVSLDESTGGADASTGGADETGDPPTGEGLPCDVDEMLQTYCRSCHGLSMLAPTPMLSRDDMLADSLTMPGTSVGAVAAMRLDDPAKPMPPLPAAPVTGDLHDAFLAWVADGMPAGDCIPAEPDPDPFDVDPVCTSDVWWTQGAFTESVHMDPGRACNACHDDPAMFGGEAGEHGPHFGAAGTVYPSGHEPDDCFGVDGSATTVTIELSHEDGQKVSRSINGAGNFFFEPGDFPDGFGPPFFVKVIAGGVERTMGEAAEHGDCNLCHTQDGTEDAPGRILIPF